FRRRPPSARITSGRDGTYHSYLKGTSWNCCARPRSGGGAVRLCGGNGVRKPLGGQVREDTMNSGLLLLTGIVAFSSARRRITGVLGVIVVASLLSGLLSFPASAQSRTPPYPQPAPPPTPPKATTQRSVHDLEAWHATMSRTPVPKEGCFNSSYPSTNWQEVPCSTEPARPHPRLFVPETLGGGNDVSALVTGSLTSATGSLLQSNVVQESDPGGQNTYSLQLNTNRFNSAALCAGRAGCVGWQQFVRENPGDVFIQYWLLNHGNPCPAKPAGFTRDWTFFAGDVSRGLVSGCFIDGNHSTVPQLQLSDLEGMRVTGNTSPSAQSVIFQALNFVITSQDPGDLLAIGNQWNQAEFNIFGACCGNQATFGAASEIVVQLAVNNGTANAPFPSSTGFTAETNNLNLVSPTCRIGGPAPAIVFTETFLTLSPTSTGIAPAAVELGKEALPTLSR